MARHHVLISDPASAVIETQIRFGRFKDFSAAVQEAVWNYFMGPPSPFDEYGVTPEEVERSARSDFEAIRRDRKRGKLKPFS